MKTTLTFSVIIILFTVNCKSSVLDILLKLGSNEQLLDFEYNELANAKPEDLPLPVRNLVRSIPAGQHLCCRNIPIVIETKSRTAKRVRAVKDTVSTSHHCGFLGTGNCGSSDEVYKQETFYVTEYYTNVRNDQCPDRHIVCCNMYLSVANRCVYLDDLHEVASQLIG